MRQLSAYSRTDRPIILNTALKDSGLEETMVIQKNDFKTGDNFAVGETGYGCHTFYITDVFRNIVIIADITLLLCLNIVSCAHINMQFVIFTS